MKNPLLLTGLLVMCAFCVEGLADSGSYERSLNIQKNIMSPFCPGQILYNCPSEKATMLKDQIEQDLTSGKSEAEVIAAIQAKYPEATYGAPPAHGLGLYVWLIPCSFLVILSASIALWFRSQLNKN
jgi:cytochrome c-type biogenesis protein CcmH